MLSYTFRAACGALALAAASAIAFAGGFYITVGNPAASSDPGARDAVAIFRATGCVSPSDAKFNATAEGLYEGKRKTVQLKLTPLSAPGTFAVKKQWPDAGVWVVAVTGRYQTWATGAIIPVSANGFDRDSVKMFQKGEAPVQEIQASLEALAAREHSAMEARSR